MSRVENTRDMMKKLGVKENSLAKSFDEFKNCDFKRSNDYIS